MFGDVEKKLDVKLYSTPYCVFCRMAKEYFTEHHVTFREINVLEDPEGRSAMEKKSGQTGVPVIDINGNIVVGFDRLRLAELLNIVTDD